jgi:hypothetical protein
MSRMLPGAIGALPLKVEKFGENCKVVHNLEQGNRKMIGTYEMKADASGRILRNSGQYRNRS